jgi:hypothetical protein
VTRNEASNFKNRLQEILATYDGRWLPHIAAEFAAARKQPDAEMQGRGREVAIEAHARTYVINPVLNALGWQLDHPGRVLVEAGVDGLQSDENANRCFLDYHGREFRNGEAISLLLVEAKRPSASLPMPGREGVPERLRRALQDINRGATVRSVNAEWSEWLSTLVTYVGRIKAAHGAAPHSVLITNGDWFVIFTSIDRSLLSTDVKAQDILVLEDHAAVNGKSDAVYGLLAYSELSPTIPPQHPAMLDRYTPGMTRIPVTFLCEVSHTRHGYLQPAIAIKVSSLVQGLNGGWIRFELEHNPIFVVLHHDRVDDDNEEIQRRAMALLDELRRYAPRGAAIELIPAKEYERIASDTDAALTPIGAGLDLLEGTVDTLFTETVGFPNTVYHCVTGDKPHYIERRATYDACEYHEWSKSNASGNAQGAAILSPSLDPRAFFPTNTHYHCAHRGVHELRANKCVIGRLEQYLCCQQCTFFTRCWGDGDARLPCQSAPPPSGWMRIPALEYLKPKLAKFPFRRR